MLTMGDVRDAMPTEKDRVVWDHPGFGVRIRPSGAKSWLVQYRAADGRTRRATLGKVGQVPLAQARREADKMIAAARLGGDPAAEKTDQRRGQTVAELAESWIEAAEIKPTTRREYQRQLDVVIVPRLGRRKARSLTRADVRDLFFEIRDGRRKPYMANRVLATLSSMLGCAARRGMISDNPAAGAVDKRDKGRERADKRHLSEEEVHRFLTASNTLRAEGGHAGRMAASFELMLLCGLRPTDVYGLRWSEVDFDAGLIRFESQKTDAATDGDAPAYLRGPAAALLRSLNRTDDTWVFPSPRKRGQPVHDGRKVWERIEELAKFDAPASPKHLRKTHGTLARNWRHDLGAISKSLRHASQSTTEKHYAFLGDSLVAAEQDVIQARIASLAGARADVRGIRG